MQIFLSVPNTSHNIVHSTEEGYKGVCHLLKSGCDATAFFCADDITAIGAMKAIKEYGLRIPEDVSVASIDDIDTAQYLIPSLTTAHIPLDEMGKMAAKILIDRIEGGHEKHLKILFPMMSSERKSTLPSVKSMATLKNNLLIAILVNNVS